MPTEEPEISGPFLQTNVRIIRLNENVFEVVVGEKDAIFVLLYLQSVRAIYGRPSITWEVVRYKTLSFCVGGEPAAVAAFMEKLHNYCSVEPVDGPGENFPPHSQPSFLWK